MYRKVLLTILTVFFVFSTVFAGEYGKISGRVYDKASGEAVIGASVMIDETKQGAATDVNGEFVILNVPVGTYSLKCSAVGFQAYTIRNLRVISDKTTPANFPMVSQAVQVGEVEVVAEKPLVDKNSTSSITTFNSDEIKNLPNRSIEGVAAYSAAMQPSGSIRGGRTDENVTLIEGVRVTNSMDGTSRLVSVISNAIEEVQVLAGGYTAEYGNANSGIIKSTFRTGTSKYRTEVELYTNRWAPNGSSLAKSIIDATEVYPGGSSVAIVTLSGPLIPGYQNIRTFVAGQFNDARNAPWRQPGFELKNVLSSSTNINTHVKDTLNIVWPAYQGNQGGYTWNWTANGNLLFDFAPFQIKFTGTYGYAGNRGRTWGFYDLVPKNRYSKTEAENYLANLKLTHFLSPKTFYNIGFSLVRNFSKYYDPDFKEEYWKYWDSTENAKLGYKLRVEQNNALYQQTATYFDWNFSLNDNDPASGYGKSGYTYIGGNFDITHQIGITHEIKAGADFTRFTYRTYSLDTRTLYNQLKLNPTQALKSDQQVWYTAGTSNVGYDIYGNPVEDGLYRPRHPIFAAAYIQDKMEFSDIVVNFGMRFDYIKTDAWSLLNKGSIKFDADGIVQQDQLLEQPAQKYITPRIGLAFPLSDRTVFFAEFGKFIQQSKLRDMIRSIRSVSQYLVGGYAYSDPNGFDLQAEKTTNYEIGFRQQMGDNFSFQLTGYYKDVKDLIQLNMQPRDPGASNESYYTLQNSDFSTVKGIEFKLNMRRTNRIMTSLEYGYSDARGTGSSTNTRFAMIWTLSSDPARFPHYVMPLSYNYNHKGSLLFDYRFGDNDGGSILQNSGIYLVFNFNSGYHYTRVDRYYLGNVTLPIEPTNTSTSPWQYFVDGRIDKTVKLGPADLNVYLQFYNILGLRTVTTVNTKTGTALTNYLDTPEGKNRGATPQEQANFEQLYYFLNLRDAGIQGPRTATIGVRFNF